jgi:hypothetical protein
VGVWVCGCVGVYTKSKTSELSPLRRKLLRFAKQFPPPLRSNYSSAITAWIDVNKQRYHFSIFTVSLAFTARSAEILGPWTTFWYRGKMGSMKIKYVKNKNSLTLKAQQHYQIFLKHLKLHFCLEKCIMDHNVYVGIKNSLEREWKHYCSVIIVIDTLCCYDRKIDVWTFIMGRCHVNDFFSVWQLKLSFWTTLFSL